MQDNKKHNNSHRTNKKTVQLVFTKKEFDRFQLAKQDLNARSAKDLVLKLLDKVKS